MKPRRQTLLALSGVLIAVSAAYFFIFALPSQRDLFLVAVEDLPFYDGVDRSKVLLTLPMGSEIKIDRCDDRKSTIEPVVKANNGRDAYPLTPKYRIKANRTGLLSLPKYLNCGDF